ncbi:MAG: DUF3098 domain-containing protein [Muribaculaceae bacterium]|nr:DUF3098 domain-containing protein [Muribaculaceae bacterium]
MKNSTEKNNSQLDPETYVEFPLVKTNFILMAIAGAAIIIGFLLMLGGSTTDAGFNPDIFSTRRIVIGPALSFLGFLFMAFAIIYRPKK